MDRVGAGSVTSGAGGVLPPVPVDDDGRRRHGHGAGQADAPHRPGPAPRAAPRARLPGLRHGVGELRRPGALVHRRVTQVGGPGGPQFVDGVHDHSSLRLRTRGRDGPRCVSIACPSRLRARCSRTRKAADEQPTTRAASLGDSPCQATRMRISRSSSGSSASARARPSARSPGRPRPPRSRRAVPRRATPAGSARGCCPAARCARRRAATAGPAPVRRPAAARRSRTSRSPPRPPPAGPHD